MGRITTLAFIAVLALAPLASAGSQAQIYYLADGEGAGSLDAAAPQGNESKTMLILPEIDGPSAIFQSESSELVQLIGPAFAGIWTQVSTAVQGNLTASLWVDNGVNLTKIAEAHHSLSVDPAMVPEPTTLLPPDPTDPEGAVFHAAAQLMPLITDPPILFDFGFLNMEIPANSSIVLGLGLTNGDQMAAGISILEYGATTSPSFAYVPWYVPNPPFIPGAPAPSPAAPMSPPAAPGDGMDDGMSPDDDGAPASDDSDEDAPGFSLLVVAVALGFVAWRRRE